VITESVQNVCCLLDMSVHIYYVLRKIIAVDGQDIQTFQMIRKLMIG